MAGEASQYGPREGEGEGEVEAEAEAEAEAGAESVGGAGAHILFKALCVGGPDVESADLNAFSTYCYPDIPFLITLSPGHPWP